MTKPKKGTVINPKKEKQKKAIADLDAATNISQLKAAIRELWGL